MLPLSPAKNKKYRQTRVFRGASEDQMRADPKRKPRPNDNRADKGKRESGLK